ncbi:MAG: Na/Pi cotransporter family protein [Flavobacteriales bacterium]|nr:Na/Pi cotransporter family protein [Flavobacteriales bacterium]
MKFDFLDFMELLGALGFFIFGMKVMSEGLQHAAGARMRMILGSMTKNRFLGVLTGFLITSLVQSSSATTVMTVSFVNAGLLSLVESAGIMMGANVGTTITGWIVASLGFKVKIVTLALPIIAVGFPMIFSKRGNMRFWGEFLIGFALLFMGLEALKDTVPDIKNSPEVLEFLSSYADMGILSTLLFVGVGTLLTIIVQSSSAAMTLTQTMCFQGWIPFEIAAPMILGENIGTTITAEIAAFIGNVHAKRSARIHSLFNVIGVTWMVFLNGFYLQKINDIMIDMGMGSPFTSDEAIPQALAIFHTAFNVSNVLLLIWFVPVLVKVVIRMVPSRGDMDEMYKLEYIDSGLMTTPELSLLEAKKEIVKFGTLTKRMIEMVPPLLRENNDKKFGELLSRVEKYENITDRIEVEVADYLSNISQGELTRESSLRVRGMLGVINDLERIGDICYQMSLWVSRKHQERVWFTQAQRENLQDMFLLICKGFDVMITNLDRPFGQVKITEADEVEIEINQLRDQLRVLHLEDLEKNEYNFRSGMIYNELFSSYEKMGDHIFNITEALIDMK